MNTSQIITLSITVISVAYIFYMDRQKQKMIHLINNKLNTLESIINRMIEGQNIYNISNLGQVELEQEVEQEVEQELNEEIIDNIYWEKEGGYNSEEYNDENNEDDENNEEGSNNEEDANYEDDENNESYLDNSKVGIENEVLDNAGNQTSEIINEVLDNQLKAEFDKFFEEQNLQINSEDSSQFDDIEIIPHSLKEIKDINVETLKGMKVTELKELARNYNIKVKGNKKNIIDTILNTIYN